MGGQSPHQRASAGALSSSSALGGSLDACRRAVEGAQSVLLDCDGVLWRGDQAVDGAAAFVQSLQRNRKRVRLITNSPVKTRAAVCHKVAALLGVDVSEDEVVTSAYCAAVYLRRAIPEGSPTVVAIGEGGVLDELRAAGFRVVEAASENDPAACPPAAFSNLPAIDGVKAVVVSLDTSFTYRALATASLALQRNPEAAFVATNRDAADAHAMADAKEKRRLMPGSGPIVAALEVASGRKAIDVGKGGAWFNRYVREDLLGGVHGEGEGAAVMIGDRIDTDIAFGKAVGVQTVLPLSGVTQVRQRPGPANEPTNLTDLSLFQIADVEAAPVEARPDHIVGSVKDLVL